MREKNLEVINVTKKIGKRVIINDLSFEICNGDICGFLGPNGAGKTTIIRLITGLIAPTHGKIFINGVNVVKDREKALSKIGAIVESPIFFNYLSARKNLDNLAILNKNMNKKERLGKVNEVLKVVELYDRADDKVGKYSLGMKQRLGIAQALLNDPEIIILDEPANGLDPMGMRDLRNLIIRLQKKRNITFFISSHLLDELQQMCNRFIMINEGKTVWQGNKEELLKLSGGSNRLEDAFIDIMTQKN